MGISTGKPASLLSAGCSFGARSVPVGIGGQNEYGNDAPVRGSEQSSGSMRILQVVGHWRRVMAAVDRLSGTFPRTGAAGNRVSIYGSAVAGREYLEVPLDRPVIEQGLRSGTSQLWPAGQVHVSPKLGRPSARRWGNSTSSTSGRCTVFSMWPQPIGAQAPGAAHPLPHGSLDPICGAATARESGSIPSFLPSASTARLRRLCSIPAKKCVWLRIGRACNRRRGQRFSTQAVCGSDRS